MAPIHLLGPMGIPNSARLTWPAGPACSSKDSTGGGDKGNHGRRRLAMGHIRSLLLKARANTAEVRALHGVAKELERVLAAEEKMGAKGRDRALN